MAFIKDNKKEIVLQNDFAKITISKKDSKVLSLVRLDNNSSFLEKECFFFTVFKSGEETVEIKGLELEENVIKLVTDSACIFIRCEVCDEYFTFEILSDLPETLEAIEFANMECLHEDGFATVDVAMTVNANPVKHPRSTQTRVRGIAKRVTGNTSGAKLAVVLAPFSLHRDILKKVCSTIDPEKGIVIRTSGAWAKDYLPNYENYMIILGTKPELVEKAEEYHAMGIDQFDFHQGEWAFWQGNFKCTKLRDMAEFKEKFSDPLAKHSISCALHTYAHYIHHTCTELLSDPEYQKDLCRGEEYTLSCDVDAEADIIEVFEDTSELSTDYGFFSTSLPYAIIGNEIISYVKDHGRFVSCARGACGTAAVAHKKGEKLYHLLGCFNLFAPVPGSPLFKRIAYNTAKAYNEGGFKMIYLDAIDGMHKHTKEAWYYDALFVHEILKHCDTPPTFEYADNPASVWCAMGRTGAWDTPWKAYRGFNKFHVKKNLEDADSCHLLGMMGWYGLYPQSDGYPIGQPGNYNTKYHHWDDAEYLGSLVLIHGYSMVYRNGLPNGRFPALDRNIKAFKKYDDLKKSRYFSEEYLAKLRDPDREYFLKDKGHGKWVFEEKAFLRQRYFDIADKSRATESFENPFGAQTPFVRIEAGLSTLGENEMVLLPIDENKNVSAEKYTYTFPNPIDCTQNGALVFKVFGNGKKGSALRVSFGCKRTRGAASYIVDTDFEGWREFVFIESDNGERPDLPFDSRDGHFYNVYLHGVRLEAMTHVSIDTAGDVEGVRMGSIRACSIEYEVIKNPRVRVGSHEIMFECELKSTDFIEWDGKRALVLDRYGDSKPVYFEGDLKVPRGKFSATLSSAASLNGGVQNLKLTLGLCGKEIK